MIKLIDLIKENSKSSYDYGCVMLYLRFPEMSKIQDAIDPKHLYEQEGDKTYGLEDEPHVTLLYGLHPEVTLDDIKKVLSKFSYSTCTLKNPSFFAQKDYDVLKLDVEGSNLHETNAELKKYPFTSDFPNYKPHITIGYLQPTVGEKYKKAFKGLKYNAVPTHAVYSEAGGKKTKIEINK